MFPACAGMIPSPLPSNSGLPSVPRMRGDDPYGDNMPLPGIAVFPACAGMIPDLVRCFAHG